MEPQKKINFLYRIFIYSFICFFRIMFSGKFASMVYAQAMLLKQEKNTLSEEEVNAEEPTQKIESSVPTPQKETLVDGIQLLSLLQKSGRLVDFLNQDITAFPDQDVAGAARVVHQGCKAVIEDYFKIVPLLTEREGSTFKVTAGYNPFEIQISGNTGKVAPFQGEVVHHGWKVETCNLPKITDARARMILAPAEVEI
ncbi:MAG: DUF2760 domain-containing protein [SAR324 cluster bacterium]|nr:DUF2760 domain-containing protein [SAR324 cluster bacterium]